MQPDFEAYTSDGFAPIPARTMLFRLEPIGIGTAQCEGLTSYLVRLAREHSLPVRRFVSRLLFSREEAQPRCDAKFFREYAATINGVGPYAQLFAQVLNAATGRTDLELLTLRPWHQLLPANGNRLTSPSRRWCQGCLAPQEARGSHVPELPVSYLPLAWSIASVHNCSRHGTPLLDRCPHCGLRQPVIPQLADFAHCHSCHLALAEPPSGRAADSSSSARADPTLAVAEELIALNPVIDPGQVHRRWTDTVSARIALMACDRAALCRRVGLNPRAMNAWMTRGTGVSIDSLTKVLGALQVSASDAFGSTAPLMPPTSGLSVPVSREHIRRRQHYSIEVRDRAATLLDQAAAADLPLKLRDIAALLGTSTCAAPGYP